MIKIIITIITTTITTTTIIIILMMIIIELITVKTKNNADDRPSIRRHRGVIFTFSSNNASNSCKSPNSKWQIPDA